MIVTFCGHSSFTASYQQEEDVVKLIKNVAKNDCVTFYLGGYGKFDIFALGCAHKYKNLFENTKIVFITPYLGDWLQKRKNDILNVYDSVIYPPLENVPYKFAISKRNQWMVQQSDFVIAYVSTHFGGAYKTLLYAHKQNKPYVNLYMGKYELY